MACTIRSSTHLLPALSSRVSHTSEGVWPAVWHAGLLAWLPCCRHAPSLKQVCLLAPCVTMRSMGHNRKKRNECAELCLHAPAMAGATCALRAVGCVVVCFLTLSYSRHALWYTHSSGMQELLLRLETDIDTAGNAACPRTTHAPTQNKCRPASKMAKVWLASPLWHSRACAHSRALLSTQGSQPADAGHVVLAAA